MSRIKVFLGVSLVTLAVLMLELALTRLFSATMFYHFAFMAISLALFGSGASGVFVYIFQQRLVNERIARWLSVSALLFALTTVFALYVIMTHHLELGAGVENYLNLAKVYAATSLPFFFAGCSVTLAIAAFSGEISRLYLFDLAGAALGCLLLIPVLNLIGAINTVLFIASIAAGAGIVFALGAKENRAYLVIAALVACGLVALTISNSYGNYIDVRKSKGEDEKDILFSKWNSFSRVTVSGDLKDVAVIKIDADAATNIARGGGASHHDDYVRNDITTMANHLKRDAKMLIIGTGGGNDIKAALLFGQKHITAVEVNPIIARDVMSSEPFLSYSGSIYQQPNVRLVVDEGRSVIRSSDERFDIIQATMVDTWAATSAGAFALTENNLYTVEAFKDYVTHLTDDGVLTMTRWYFEPPDQLLRLVTLTRAMMLELGISNPSRHIVLVRMLNDDQRAPATFIFKKSEFTDDEVRRLETVAQKNNYGVLYSPLTRPDNVFTRMVEAPDPSVVWDGFVTNIEPTRDNNPFFFNSLRPSNLMAALTGGYEWQKTNLGTFVLFALFVITTVLVGVFIIGPLLLVRRQALSTGTSTKLSFLFYFACLGAGFIIVEVAMIQKFILFLGHPVYALSVVLFSLLTFSALGSYLSGRFDDAKLKPTLAKVLIGLVVLVFVYIIVLPPIFYGLVHFERVYRIAISVALMAPIALLMGMPMPTGIRILRAYAPEIIPWAWGVNGATSVMGSVAALILAILMGFNQALVVGAGLYLLAIYFIVRPQVETRRAVVEEEKVYT